MGLARLGKSGGQTVKPEAPQPTASRSTPAPAAKRRGLASLAGRASEGSPESIAAAVTVADRHHADPFSGRGSPPADLGYDATLDWAARGNPPGPDDVDLAVRAWLGARP